MRLTNTKGFTIIELLAVAAIIAILATVVITSLADARAKGRDAKRISDIKNIELALKLYSVDNGSTYPAYNQLEAELVPNYLPAMPRDPLYPNREYLYNTTGQFGSVSGFNLGAVLETNHSALMDDATVGTAAHGSPAFHGNSVGGGSPFRCSTDDAGAAPDNGERCYNVRN
jgi:prepilin-type N-terminal cleavage/methylation domain-containing protein